MTAKDIEEMHQAALQLVGAHNLVRSILQRLDTLEQALWAPGPLPATGNASSPSSAPSLGPASKPSELPHVNLLFERGLYLLTVQTGDSCRLISYTSEELGAILSFFSTLALTPKSPMPSMPTQAAGAPGHAAPDHTPSSTEEG